MSDSWAQDVAATHKHLSHSSILSPHTFEYKLGFNLNQILSPS